MIIIGELINGMYKDVGKAIVNKEKDVIEHLADPHKFLDEVGRVIKKGGILALRTPNADALFLKINKLINRML